ncbi:polysaccharide biosynthesis/export family protein [Psychroflexus sp. ALD_RP9]|uniref:polysaccharide biosynthesis/export family protein n=1 Tax=Psychroflexus sp. ALD_RP9 TaxID=2777186 RepID=UPI001A90AEB1|nr:polysaccharide biosynthesis/export family protein [Psychroflexus sp. ALD_RP9]QSS98004.1 polysaccharide biosynthesis/export family protein [Psychroflexus sp. ALD_RP9]
MKKFGFLLLIVMIVTSCATRKEVVYYQNSSDVNLSAIEKVYTHPVIQTNHILHISISSANPESIAAFSREAGAQQMQARQIQMLKVEGYLVNENGEINFPELGKIKVRGLTTQKAQDLIESQLKAYVKDATVNIRIINNSFTVQGEVRQPGTYEIIDERVTLPQALGLAGGLTIRGQRDNIKIFRQLEDKRVVKTIDLTSVDWMNTDYYYINPNDIIYIEPNDPQIKSAGFITNVGTLLSVFSILLSTAVLLFR